MSDIDWSKAPEATHWTPSGLGVYEAFWRFDGDKCTGAWVIEGGGIKYYPSAMGPSRQETLVAKPGEKSWTGTGLPPFGVEVECSYACEDFLKWHEGICIAVGRDPEGREICVVQSGETLANYRSEAGRVRPRRTKAQIEAEEREEFAHRLVEEMGKSPTGYPNAMNQARKIYDLGYRKQGEDK